MSHRARQADARGAGKRALVVAAWGVARDSAPSPGRRRSRFRRLEMPPIAQGVKAPIAPQPIPSLYWFRQEAECGSCDSASR